MSSGDTVIHPDIVKLARIRGVCVKLLSYFLLVLFAGNICLLSFAGSIAAKPIFSGSPITIGIAYSTLLVIAGACVAIVYTFWANKRLDPLLKRILTVLQESDGASNE